MTGAHQNHVQDCVRVQGRGGTTRVVQYGAIDHVLSYNLSRGVLLFVSNCTTRVVPPLCTRCV